MLEYFFGSMCKIIFEPLAVTVLLWCLYTFFFRKRNKTLFWVITGSVLFMIVWRLAVHSVMLSGRYSAMLIFPTIVFCACFCVKTPVFFRWLFRKFRWNFQHKRALCYFLGAAAFIGLSIGCVLKNLRYNPYADCEKKIAQFYLKHRKGPGEFHVFTKSLNRFAWYAKKRPSEVIHTPWPENRPVIPLIKQSIEKLKNLRGDHYFVFILKKGDVEPTAENMKLPPEYGSWEIVMRIFDSKKKKKEILLCHYKPVCPDIQEWKGPIPAQLPINNICRNGDFERLLAGRHLRNVQTSYIKNQVKNYMDLSQRKLPWDWWFSIGKWNRNNPPDVRLTEKAPLAGKYSLQVDARPPASWGHCYSWHYIHNKRCRYTLFVRGEGEKTSEFAITAISRNINSKKYRVSLNHRFLLQPGKTYRIHGTIPVDQFPAGFRNFNIRLDIRGFVTIDQVNLIPY